MAKPTIASATPPVLVSARRPRWRVWLARSGMVVAGLAVGLVVAELVFRIRADGAFPHVNVYLPDPELGVRLAPGEGQRISFGGNPVTSIEINSAGYRGRDLPAPGVDEVLVVGDSQVFGLGVEGNQTFSAQLEGALKRTVINGGVPTYGPAEYRAVIDELLAKRPGAVKTVVVTINLVNDLFEADRPNVDRHAVWDGWAVRKETAPERTTWFPGRDFLYRRSHLFFALRKWWHRGEVLDEGGFASEGTWQDVVSIGEKVRAERGAVDQRVRAHSEELDQLQRELVATEDGIDDAISRELRSSETYEDNVLVKARANPGDIVDEFEDAEASRAVVVTSGQIRRAAMIRAKLRTELERWAKARRDGSARHVLSQLDARGALIARLTEVDAQRIEAALDPPLAGYLRDVKQLVEAQGARLVVLVLPIDVQVSPKEWEKYGADPIDMSPTNTLIAELVELGTSLGVTVVDATPALAAAEPGAFLDKDIHMTAKGHAAVAKALAAAILAPPPPVTTGSERSPVPVPAVWNETPEVIVTGSTAAGCETKKVREWLRVLCNRTAAAGPPEGVTIDRDDSEQAMSLVTPHGVALVIPVIEGGEYAATLRWGGTTRTLRVRWPDGDPKPTMAFDQPISTRAASPAQNPRADRTTFASPVERAICDCWNRVHGGVRYSQGRLCAGAYGATDAACVARYGPASIPRELVAAPLDPAVPAPAQCEQLLACIRRDPASPP